MQAQPTGASAATAGSLSLHVSAQLLGKPRALALSRSLSLSLSLLPARLPAGREAQAFQGSLHPQPSAGNLALRPRRWQGQRGCLQKPGTSRWVTFGPGDPG
jgi:hypothetical protein